jgi:hypothetical protein
MRGSCLSSFGLRLFLVTDQLSLVTAFPIASLSDWRFVICDFCSRQFDSPSRLTAPITIAGECVTWRWQSGERVADSFVIGDLRFAVFAVGNVIHLSPDTTDYRCGEVCHLALR